MAAMQAMLNSMTPEQRAQLQELSDQLLGDMDLRWQMDQLGQHLRSLFPQQGWNQSYDFQGQDPLGMGQAMQTMQELGDLDQLENLLRARQYFRFQASFKDQHLRLDDAGVENMAALTEAAEELIVTRSDDIDTVCERLTA